MCKAKQMIEQQGGTKSPNTMFVVMMNLLSFQVSGVHRETFRTYFSDPPSVHPPVWTEEPIPECTNDTHILEGFTDKHVTLIHLTGLIILAMVEIYLYVGPMINMLAVEK